MSSSGRSIPVVEKTASSFTVKGRVKPLQKDSLKRNCHFNDLLKKEIVMHSK
jgi:hypothetical protein